MYPESALVYLGADMGIKGEGEVVFPDLVDRIKQGKDVSDLPGLYLPGQGAKDRKSLCEGFGSPGFS